MKQSIYFIGLLALLAACNSPKTEEAKQQSQAALQEESMPVASLSQAPRRPTRNLRTSLMCRKTSMAMV